MNGQPVKGTLVIRGQRIQMSPTPNPGRAIGDVARGTIQDFTYEILTLDGLLIGSIMGSGLGLGSAPPGLPLSASGNYAIVGGTGAFVGARGQMSGITPVEIPVRGASMTEDPANLRIYGGWRRRVVADLIPMTRPEIVTTSSGAAVFHGDLSPVTATKPAKAGEGLITMATGLGPTRPGVDPGQPFPANPLQLVNSPEEVKANGQSASAFNAIGWRGLVDTYRVDFRVPDRIAAGMATVQLSAAWIAGPSVNIPIQ